MTKQISTRVLAEILNDKNQTHNVFIDVRNQDEYDQVKVNGFTLICVSEDGFAKKVEVFLQNKIKQQNLKQGDTLEVYMMCRGGVRSSKACSICEDDISDEIDGVKINYNNIIGGIMSWLNENPR